MVSKNPGIIYLFYLYLIFSAVLFPHKAIGHSYFVQMPN